jgi:hypothetical protein
LALNGTVGNRWSEGELASTLPSRGYQLAYPCNKAPIRHLLTRSLAEIPIGGPEYQQVDRVVQEIDGLAKILIGDGARFYQKEHSAPDNSAG